MLPPDGWQLEAEMHSPSTNKKPVRRTYCDVNYREVRKSERSCQCCRFRRLDAQPFLAIAAIRYLVKFLDELRHRKVT